MKVLKLKYNNRPVQADLDTTACLCETREQVKCCNEGQARPETIINQFQGHRKVLGKTHQDTSMKCSYNCW